MKLFRNLKIIGICVLLFAIIGPFFGFGLMDLILTVVAERATAPYDSYLDTYFTSNINKSVLVGGRSYVFKNNILYYVKKNNEETEIGDLKVNIGRNISEGDPLQYYTFKDSGNFYYISGDSLFRIVDNLIYLTKLKMNPEGFFVSQGSLYYAYGWEMTVDNGTIGGPVSSKYKRYGFRQLNLATLESHDISRQYYMNMREREH